VILSMFPVHVASASIFKTIRSVLAIEPVPKVKWFTEPPESTVASRLPIRPPAPSEPVLYAYRLPRSKKPVLPGIFA